MYKLILKMCLLLFVLKFIYKTMFIVVKGHLRESAAEVGQVAGEPVFGET